MKLNRLSFLVAVAVIFLFPGFSGSANAADKLSLTMETGLVVIDYIDGKKVEKIIAAPKEVRPGEKIQYVINGKNTSGGALRNIAVDGRIPMGTTYIPASAQNDTRAMVLFSINKGKKFQKPPIMEEVTLPSGEKESREVSPDRYTNIRFVIKDLSAREQFTSVYRVQVK